MEKTFGKKTIFIREGGSIPIVSGFFKKFKSPGCFNGIGIKFGKSSFAK